MLSDDEIIAAVQAFVETRENVWVKPHGSVPMLDAVHETVVIAETLFALGWTYDRAKRCFRRPPSPPPSIDRRFLLEA